MKKNIYVTQMTHRLVCSVLNEDTERSNIDSNCSDGVLAGRSKDTGLVYILVWQLSSTRTNAA